MLYLFSDDYYYSQGVEALLTAHRLSVSIVSTSCMQYFSDFGALDICDVFIITTDHFPMFYEVLNVALENNIRVISVMDIRQLSNPELLWRNGIFSKNMLCESYIPALLCVLNSKTDLTPEFTGRELKVLDLLLDGKSASVVSEKMHLSVKTISSLKVKALRKLGLHNANTQALIIYGKYRQIQKHRHLLNHFSEKNI